MRPLKVIVEDFLPFRGKVEIDLSKVHAATVTGRNGAGKSSFFIDAILFALFGQARKRPEGLINDLSTKMKVNLYFQHRDQSYLVERSIEHNKQQRLKFFLIGANGREDLSERLLTETQKKLVDVLGISYGLLLSTSIAQQEDINRLFSLTANQRQDMITEMLSLDYWDKKKEVIAEHLKNSKELEDDIDKAQTELALADGQIETIQKVVSEHRDNLKPLLVKKNELSKQVSEKQAESAQVVERQRLQQEHSVLMGKLEGMEERIKDLLKLPTRLLVQEEVEKLTEDIKDFKMIATAADVQQEELKRQQEDLRRKDIEVASLMGQQQDVNILTLVPCVGTDYHAKCQLLSQAKDTQKEIVKYLEGLSNRYATLEDFQKYLHDRQDKIKEGLDRLTDAKNSAARRQVDAEGSLLESKSMLLDIDEGLALNKSADTLRDQIETLSRKIKRLPELDLEGLLQLQSDLTETIEDIGDIEKGIATGEKEQELVSKIIPKIKANLATYEAEETKIASYRVLNQAYSEIPAHLFGEAIPHIETYANEILGKIDPMKRIQLRPFKDTKSGTQMKALDVLGYTGTGLRDFENLSGSEKFRQGLAVRAALARVNAEMYNTQIGFFIIDEGFGSLDEENVDIVKDVLREVAKQFDLFLVITHIEALKDTFDEEIHVSSLKDGSHIDILKH